MSNFHRLDILTKNVQMPRFTPPPPFTHSLQLGFSSVAAPAVAAAAPAAAAAVPAAPPKPQLKAKYGGLSDQDRIFTNIYGKHDPFVTVRTVFSSTYQKL